MKNDEMENDVYPRAYLSCCLVSVLTGIVSRMKRIGRITHVLTTGLALTILITLLLFEAVVAQQPHTTTGDMRLHQKFHSKILNNDRDVLVYLPPGYDKDKTRRYSVLYLHDGQNLFDGATSFIPGAGVAGR